MAFLNVLINHPLGTIYPFTDATNTLIDLISPATQVGYQFPSQQMLDSHRLLVFAPVSTGGRVVSLEGIDVTTHILAMSGSMIGTADGIPMVLAAPTAGVPTAIIQVNVGGRIVALPAAVLYLIALAIFTILVSWVAYWANAPAVEREKTEQLRIQMLMKATTIEREETIDVNGDGTPDVKRVFYGNGDVIIFALTQVGVDFIGGTTKTERTGLDLNDLLDKLYQEGTFTNILWIVALGVVGIAALYFLGPQIQEAVESGVERARAGIRRVRERAAEYIAPG